MQLPEHILSPMHCVYKLPMICFTLLMDLGQKRNPHTPSWVFVFILDRITDTWKSLEE